MLQAKTTPSLFIPKPSSVHKSDETNCGLFAIKSIHIHLYLNDWLIRAESKERVLQDAQVVLNLISDLGLLLNMEKSTLFPTQNLVYLGVDIDLKVGLCKPASDKLEKIRNSQLAPNVKQREGSLSQEFPEFSGWEVGTRSVSLFRETWDLFKWCFNKRVIKGQLRSGEASVGQVHIPVSGQYSGSDRPSRHTTLHQRRDLGEIRSWRWSTKFPHIFNVDLSTSYKRYKLMLFQCWIDVVCQLMSSTLPICWISTFVQCHFSP